jgi:hypothetical protein
MQFNEPFWYTEGDHVPYRIALHAGSQRNWLSIFSTKGRMSGGHRYDCPRCNHTYCPDLTPGSSTPMTSGVHPNGETVIQSIHVATLDANGLRTRLRRMSDEELRKFGKAARYMVSPTANMGNAPLPTFVLQLEAARAEWRVRHSEESAKGN